MIFKQKNKESSMILFIKLKNKWNELYYLEMLS